MMKFYDALQLDPSILKRKIAACDIKKEKIYYWTAIAVRSALIVGFAIVFISLLSQEFGADNTPLAVALFCMMLGIRFVNFEYCVGDSLLTLAAVLAILVLASSAAVVLPPVFLIPLHFAAFFAVLYMTTQRPEMGNGGLCSFAYIYLTGNPVLGEALVRRGLLALVGYLICAAILFFKHRHQHRGLHPHAAGGPEARLQDGIQGLPIHLPGLIAADAAALAQGLQNFIHVCHVLSVCRIFLSIISRFRQSANQIFRRCRLISPGNGA